jgi:hypothetical protein
LQISAGSEVALYIADSINNKIRVVELSSGKYASSVFDSNVDGFFASTGSAFLSGLVVHNPSRKLYAGGIGAVFRYDLSVGASSKVVYAGRQIISDPLACKSRII